MERKNNKGSYGNGGHRDAGSRRDRGERTRDSSPVQSRELDENVIIGRNAVRELLMGGRDVERLYITSGEREGSINQLLGIAAERGIH